MPCKQKDTIKKAILWLKKHRDDSKLERAERNLNEAIQAMIKETIEG